MLVFLDTEFTSLLEPELLSLGMVTSAEPAIEFYAELDLQSAEGLERKQRSSDMVLDQVLPQWGAVASAAGTHWQMGRRAGEWLIAMHALHLAVDAHQGALLEVGCDYDADWDLLEAAIRNAGLWDQVGPLVRYIDLDRLAGSIEAELAAEECFAQLRRRRLYRHHALADALALRAGYLAVKARLMAKPAD